MRSIQQPSKSAKQISKKAARLTAKLVSITNRRTSSVCKDKGEAVTQVEIPSALCSRHVSWRRDSSWSSGRTLGGKLNGLRREGARSQEVPSLICRPSIQACHLITSPLLSQEVTGCIPQGLKRQSWQGSGEAAASSRGNAFSSTPSSVAWGDSKLRSLGRGRARAGWPTPPGPLVGRAEGLGLASGWASQTQWLYSRLSHGP